MVFGASAAACQQSTSLSSRRIIVQLKYPIILSHILVVVAFSFEGWSPEVGSIQLRHNIPADASYRRASFSPTASNSNELCSCVRWTQVIIFLVWFGLFSSRLCWCLRTYALWNRRRWLLVLGLPAIIAESSVILWASLKLTHVPIPPGIQQVCIASPGTGLWSIMTWVMPLSFDTAMSALAIIRAMRVSRKLKTPLTKQLIRDGERIICSARVQRFLNIWQGFRITGTRR